MVPDIAKKGHSFKGAFQYYLHDKGADTSERVGWTETRNVMTDDPTEARNIMIATAMQSDELKKSAGIKTTGRKSNQHVYAYALAWHPDEADQIDKAEMLRAVDESLKELKADHLQAVVVCHTDQKHPHVHVILNRVDPSDGRMHGFKNDRLQLSDWANHYERERGNIVTPAREEKRQKRDQHRDKEQRQAYAQQKRQEASQRPRGDLSPIAMLKDLSDAQKARHRDEWKDLSATNKARRNSIYDAYRQRIRDAVALHKTECKPIWRTYFREQRQRETDFKRREGSIIGVVQNAMATTAHQHMTGQLDGRGHLSATFTNALSSQRRKQAFEERLAMDRTQLSDRLRGILDDEVKGIQTERGTALKDQRASFDSSRGELIERQDKEREKIREAWRQIYHDRGKPFTRRSTKDEPVKRDFDNSRKIDTPKPKPQPTRQATVSTPSPAPAPKGEVPRSTAKAQTVPAKKWDKPAPSTEKRGLSGTEPAKKDWSKTGATKQAVTPPKDWGKKVEPSKPRPAPRPSKDMDRSR
jgi:hypothetical protein